MASEALFTIVDARLDESRRPWWRSAVGGTFERARFLAAFAGAGRRLGHAPVRLSAEEQTGLAGVPVQPEGWPLDEVGRLTLLAAALERLPAGEQVPLVEEIYRTGDLAEKVSVLRALPLLPGAERFVAVAREGVRSNASGILEAIACDNEYPQHHLPEDAWNQMVMKAVFNGLALARVRGLERRRNAELARIARDFAAERRAASRPVPADLDLISGEPKP